MWKGLTKKKPLKDVTAVYTSSFPQMICISHPGSRAFASLPSHPHSRRLTRHRQTASVAAQLADDGHQSPETPT